MNLYIRLLFVLWQGKYAAMRAGRQPLDGVRSNTFRVWPHDLDAFGHMNNGRYLQIMDVARAQWMLSTGVFRAMRQNKWGAILGGNITRYRRALKLWQVYRVRTQLLCWDEHWFFFEHKFVDGNDRCVAVGLSRAALRSGGTWVAARDAVASTDPGACSAPFPAHVRRWQGLEDDMYRHTHGESQPAVELLKGACS